MDKLPKCMIVVLAATVLGANASLLSGVTVESFSSEISSPDRHAGNTVDGSGLSGAGSATDTHGTTPEDMWITVGDTAFGTDLDPSITFDLGGQYDVDTLRIWNFNEATFTHHGADEILVSAGASLGSLTQTQTVNVAEGGGTATEAAQDFASTFSGVQYIKFTINSNHDGDDFVNNVFTNSTEQFAGLSEVLFEGTLVAPPDLLATNPSPSDAQTELEVNISLTWDANDPSNEVSQFNVYIGVGAQSYNYLVDSNSVPRGVMETHSYTPPANMIQTGGPYWWRVDKVTASETITGTVWTFDTRDETTVEKDARMAWFREGKMFTAWYYGLYCGAEGVWPPQTGTHDPAWTYAEWMQYWAGEATLDYRDALEPYLNGTNFNATAQAQLCKAAGMECVYVVARHHDGYALWDTATTTLLATNGFEIANSPYNPTNRDYLKEIVDALHAEGLKVGLYFSLGDWHHPDFPKGGAWAHPTPGVSNPPGHVEDFSNYIDYLHQQCTEIIDPTVGTDYGTFDVIYFDYSSSGINGEDWGASKLVHLVRKHNPNVIINNRLWNGLDNPNGDFSTPEANIDNVDYGEYGDRDWEAIMSVTEPPTWGYGGTTHYPFKSVSDLLWDVVDAVGKGGTIEVSFSPKADGTIHPELIVQYTALGAWMATNSASIKGTTANPISVRPSWGEYTSKVAQNRLYMHVFNHPGDGNIVAEGLVGTVNGAWLLADGTPLTVTPIAEGFQVHLPAMVDPVNTVIVVDYVFPEDPITTTTVADVSSENVIGLDRAAIHTVDASGLTAGSGSAHLHAEGENGIVWTTGGSLGPVIDYDPYIIFDLGGVYDVTSIREWGYNAAFDLGGGTLIAVIGPDEIDVYTSTNGVDFTFAETVNFAQAPGTDGYTGNEITIDYSRVRYIKLDIMNNHDGAVFDGSGSIGGSDGRHLTGLSEIRFGTRADAVDDLGISVESGSSIVLAWTAENGKPYRVDTNFNLTVDNWQPYTNITGSGGTITVTNGIGPESLFYKVISE